MKFSSLARLIADDFTWEFDSYFGNCYVFNSGFNSRDRKRVELKKTYLSNSQFGLNVALYVNFNQNFPIFSRGLGLMIKIKSFIAEWWIH
jgi:hypothetical protein